MSKYYEWGDFKHIYLEDSFVLNIEESEIQISFTVEMVLTENHPLYTPPSSRDKYCYKTGKIIFRRLESVSWISKNMQQFIDADETVDYGNIDLFELNPDGYHILGDWGEVIIEAPSLKLEWVTKPESGAVL